MRVLQNIPYMLASHGGPSTCTKDLMEGMFCVNANDTLRYDNKTADDYDGGNCVELLTSYPAGEGEKVLGFGSPWMKAVECDYKTPLALSKNTDRYLHETEYDLYHANTLWLYPTHATCRYAKKVGKPYILSPHGMLYPTALAVSAWKKKLMGALWYRKDVMQADCLHATCMQEMEHCRAFGYKGPIAVIPNPVVFPEGIEVKAESLELRDERGRRRIGFLGRLHPIKKVEQVIYAMDLLNQELKISDLISFQILGKYDDAYEQWLKDEVKRLDLEDCVEFVGFVSGKDKYDRLAKLSALMVPSAQENFGMIVPEALICGTPVYASLGTPWEELNGNDNHNPNRCGWWRDNSAEIIAEVINEILSLSDAELLEMGRRGRMLIEEKYEQHKVAQMMLDLYRWMLGEGEKPAFVYE